MTSIYINIILDQLCALFQSKTFVFSIDKST